MVNDNFPEELTNKAFDIAKYLGIRRLRQFDIQKGRFYRWFVFLSLRLQGYIENLKQFPDSGVILMQLQKNSLVQRIGLQEGDIFDRINDRSSRNARELFEQMATLEIGELIEIEILRKGKREKFIVPSNR